MTAEQQRLLDTRNKVAAWDNWGPYLSDRQWGTVREDYSADGDAWRYTTHAMARSLAYRWGEEGIGGFSDERQILCFALGFWNEKDEMLKERFFGLSNPEGNHGEDVKELYYYLDATPSHAYQRMLYKYPQTAFPYADLVAENGRRSRQEPEYELIDTGVFDADRYFDIYIEYAKAGPNDLLIRVTAHNRGPAAAPLHLLPTLWYRNTWRWGYYDYVPRIRRRADNALLAQHEELDQHYHLYVNGAAEPLFCDNETNRERIFTDEPVTAYPKDGINDYVVAGETGRVNPEQYGTKAAWHRRVEIAAGGSHTLELRLSDRELAQPFADFDAIFATRLAEADAFYGQLQTGMTNADARRVQRQAFAGMLWSKQLYYYNIHQWLTGDPAFPPPPAARLRGRNHEWRHLNNFDIISMPDKWEYPWYATWDLAFHTAVLAHLDPDFAKKQLRRLTREWYMHPNGTLPAYEWNFDDVNPPVHAWATWRVYRIDQRNNGGVGDRVFLESVFHKLLLNFTWWVNRKDKQGNNLFEGGFLGLDNIGIFDRNVPLAGGTKLEQSDATSWMAMFSLRMMRMALELAKENPVYQDLASKFFEHFLLIADAMASFNDNDGLWDEEDKFYYDALRHADGSVEKLRVRSMVGLIPLFAVGVLNDEIFHTQHEFTRRLNYFLANRTDLAKLVSRWQEKGVGEKHLLSLLRGHRFKRILYRMLDEDEFLSPYGIRSLSKYHEKHPFELRENGNHHRIGYLPGESDSGMFGGNSNWRGPIWFPVNYLILESLRRFYHYYGDDFTVEYPTGSGNHLTILDITCRLAERLTRIFLRDEQGRRPVYGDQDKFQTDPHFRDHILFYEYFHGDDGRGLGAAHQTGWTGLVALLLFPLEDWERSF
jgi:hypothetical protein